MASTPSCSPGFSPDNVLRLPMPVGPFNEPLGTDCFRNDLAFSVIAWIIVVLSSIAIVVFVKELHERQLGLWLRAAFISQIMCLISLIIFCIVGIYRPEGCFSVWVAFSFWLIVWVLCYLKVGLDGAITSITQVMNVSMIEVIGGLPLVTFAIILGISCFTAIMVGAIGTAVAVSEGNVQAAVPFWTAHCTGFAAWIGFGTFHNYYALGKFLETVKSVSSHVADNQSSERKRAFEDVVERIQNGRNMMLGSLPLGCGAWIVHAFVLPVFWYIAFAHCFNMLFGTFAAIYMHSPDARRKKIMSCWRSISSRHSVKNTGRVNASGPQQSLSTINRDVS